ncbi:hypothetical protein Thiosp_00447 [Thiorhodovibrio litoralis]|nr:hypothetical protein Thiosp_00447 [Thiorhodovibrio litoralis]
MPKHCANNNLIFLCTAWQPKVARLVIKALKSSYYTQID